MTTLIIGAVVVLGLLGAVVYFWRSKVVVENQLAAERASKDSVRNQAATWQRELDDARAALAVARDEVEGLKRVRNTLREERDAARAQLDALASGDQRLKATLNGGV